MFLILRTMLKGRVYTFNRRENWGLGKLNDPPEVSQCRIWHVRALTWIFAESMLKELDLKPRLNSFQNLTLYLHMPPHLSLWPAKSSSPSVTVSRHMSKKASPGQTKLKTGEGVMCRPHSTWSRSEDSNPETWMVWFLKSAFSTTIEKVEISTFYFVEIVLLKESRCQPAKAIGSIWYREK